MNKTAIDPKTWPYALLILTHTGLFAYWRKEPSLVEAQKDARKAARNGVRKVRVMRVFEPGKSKLIEEVNGKPWRPPSFSKPTAAAKNSTPPSKPSSKTHMIRRLM